MEELIDVLDENGVKTGEILTRKEIHKRGLWHRAIAVAVINEQNQILVQQRSFKKKKYRNVGYICSRTYIFWTGCTFRSF